ncbi:MAG TPA: preprotein translocase subunit SecE [Patescibacteria group bacterium]|nr:preprotein translocase subunit SecE [Patescibacteria group bacterium]
MTSPVTFLQQTAEELKKVVWPSRQEVIRLTLIVITISVAVGMYIGALDYMFTKGFELILK